MAQQLIMKKKTIRLEVVPVRELDDNALAALALRMQEWLGRDAAYAGMERIVGYVSRQRGRS